MLGTEAKALARAAGITCTTSKKSAQVSALIHCYLLAEPTPPLNALLSSWSPSELARLLRAGSGVYAVLDRRYDKRGLQGLLDQLGQPRSAKNKRILIQRIFETFLARELAANLL